MKEYSDFIRGMGSTIELFPTENDRKLKADFLQNDMEALCKDWENVGQDIRNAIIEVSSSNARK